MTMVPGITRSAGVFLTGSQPLKTEGKIRAGGSVDQLAAAQLGGETRFPSLELGTEGGRPYGKCDSGYSCAYSNSISWRDPKTPMMKMTDPREVFERLFGDIVGKDAKRVTAERSSYRKSVLDYVLDDAKRLENKVGNSDKQKLDEYLTSVREIERRIEGAEDSEGDVQKAITYFGRPEGTPDTAEGHLRLLISDGPDSRLFVYVRQRREQPRLPRDRNQRRSPLALAPPGATR